MTAATMAAERAARQAQQLRADLVAQQTQYEARLHDALKASRPVPPSSHPTHPTQPSNPPPIPIP